MIKPERIIKFVKIIFHKKFLPFWFIFFIAVIISVGIFIQKYRIYLQQYYSSNFIHDHLNDQLISGISDVVEPDTVESTRIFYFISQSLSNSGFIRCDQYLPDINCYNELSKIEKMSFYEIRHSVTKTENGFNLSGIKPPYHTLKTMVINTGHPKSNYIGVVVYTGKNVRNRMYNLLLLLNSFFIQNDQCNPLYMRWYLVEDLSIGEFLESEFGLPVLQLHQSINIFKKDSNNRWKYSKEQNDKLLEYLNHDLSNTKNISYKNLNSLLCEE